MAGIYYKTTIAGEPILLSAEEVEGVAAKISGYGQTRPLSTENEGQRRERPWILYRRGARRFRALALLTRIGGPPFEQMR
jgi:hypothetical protein